jgi:hypothetical protein
LSLRRPYKSTANLPHGHQHVSLDHHARTNTNTVYAPHRRRPITHHATSDDTHDADATHATRQAQGAPAAPARHTQTLAHEIHPHQAPAPLRRACCCARPARPARPGRPAAGAVEDARRRGPQEPLSHLSTLRARFVHTSFCSNTSSFS